MADQKQVLDWQMVRQVARRYLYQKGTQPVPVKDADQMRNALQIADLWLDTATSLTPTKMMRQVWSPQTWVEATVPSWQKICDPMVANVVRALIAAIEAQMREMGLDPEGIKAQLASSDAESVVSIFDLENLVNMLASSIFASQIGTAMGEIAEIAFGSTDIGLPLTEQPIMGLVVANIDDFAEESDVDPDSLRQFLAVREAAHARLFNSVPWLRSRLTMLIQRYASEIELSEETIHDATRQIQEKIDEAMREAEERMREAQMSGFDDSSDEDGDGSGGTGASNKENGTPANPFGALFPGFPGFPLPPGMGSVLGNPAELFGNMFGQSNGEDSDADDAKDRSAKGFPGFPGLPGLPGGMIPPGMIGLDVGQLIGQFKIENLFNQNPSERMQIALAEFQTLHAAIEGWVDDVTTQACLPYLPDSLKIQEMLRRRRAEGSSIEKVLKPIVGLELAPKQTRGAAKLWQTIRLKEGVEGRDAYWSHPDSMPNLEDLEHPDSFFERKDARAQESSKWDSELDSLLAGTLGWADGLGPDQDSEGDTKLNDQNDPEN